MLNKILKILDRDLNLHGAALQFTEKTVLRGALAQLDSMAVVTIVASLEETFGFDFPEEKLDGAIFETVGSLVSTVHDLVDSK